jgi:hypothetical protein
MKHPYLLLSDGQPEGTVLVGPFTKMDDLLEVAQWAADSPSMEWFAQVSPMPVEEFWNTMTITLVRKEAG